MKSMYARATVGALCAAMLAGCGGSDNGNLQLTVTVYGLVKPGLVLKNGDQTVTVTPGTSIAGTTTAYFPNLIAEDSTINIEVQTQATATECKVEAASGTNIKANYYSALQPKVICTTNAYQLGGSVTGLTQDQLVLTNGSLTATIPANATSFTFPSPVYDGFNYGVTVLQQPQGLTCTVANPVGTMPSGDVMNLAVSCVPRAS
jgi:hypothetical protein